MSTKFSDLGVPQWIVEALNQRGITEPFVSFGQSVGAISAGIIFDMRDSYEMTFPVFTIIGIIGAILMIFLKKIPDKK